MCATPPGRWRQLHNNSTRTAAALSAGFATIVDHVELEQHQQHGAEVEEQQQQPYVAGVKQGFEQLGLSCTSEVALASVLELWWDDGKQCLAHRSRSSKAYVMPRSNNNAAWDAVAMAGPSNPLILQFTVNRTCGIKAQPVQALLGRLDPGVSSAARLVFVVPSDVFDRQTAFPWQPWQAGKGQVMKGVLPELQRRQQWVMELQVQPNIGSSSTGSSGRSTG